MLKLLPWDPARVDRASDWGPNSFLFVGQVRSTGTELEHGAETQCEREGLTPSVQRVCVGGHFPVLPADILAGSFSPHLSQAGQGGVCSLIPA